MEEKSIFYTRAGLMVNTYDIDIAGHVNNITYVRWLEDLRHKLFNNFLPVNELVSQRLYPVVASTEIRYRKQIRFDDRPFGIMFLDRLERNVWILRAEILNGPVLCARAVQKCMLINLDDNTVQKPPRNLVQLFKAVKNDLQNITSHSINV